MTGQLASTSWAPATAAVHADDHLAVLASTAGNKLPDVAPPLHVSTTFRHNKDPSKLVPARDAPPGIPEGHEYSRETAPNSTRLEALLSANMNGKALAYASGLNALFATYVFLNPKRISIGHGDLAGYHGAHNVLKLIRKLSGAEILPLDCPVEELQAGDVIHLETPINPSGEALDISAYAAKAHSVGAYLLVDSTLAPPPLQDPFLHGADIVMHSGTKFVGGHSDMLLGVLVVKDDPRGREWHQRLLVERKVMGSICGNMEGWLGVRSMRTLELRVIQQTKNAEKLVEWLRGLLEDGQNGGTREGQLIRHWIAGVRHASIQRGKPNMEWLAKQMPKGGPPVFSILLKSEDVARVFPTNLQLFQHATSMGGVESLVEWRALCDTVVDPRLVRFSVGVEDVEDLKNDIIQALSSLTG